MNVYDAPFIQSNTNGRKTKCPYCKFKFIPTNKDILNITKGRYPW